MADRYIVGTEAEITKLRDALDQLMGLPQKGQHVGGGRHVDVPDTPGIGWREHSAPITEHPTQRGTFALHVTRHVEAHNGRTARVRGEDVTIDTAAAVDRTAEWDGEREKPEPDAARGQGVR